MAVDSIARAMAATRNLVTAYQYAVAAGYTGTEDDFKTDMGAIAGDTAQIAQNTSDIAFLLGVINGDLTAYKADTLTAPANITAGEYILAAGTLYRATANIASGSTLTPNGNVVAVTIGGELTSIATTLANKADKNGVIDNARQLLSTVGIEDKVPYNFRTSGGAADIGDRETDTVIGGTLLWNQKCPVFAVNEGWSRRSADHTSIAWGTNTVTVTLTSNATNGQSYNYTLRNTDASVYRGANTIYLMAVDFYSEKPVSHVSLPYGADKTFEVSSGWTHIVSIFKLSSASSTLTFGITNPISDGYDTGDSYVMANPMLISLTGVFGGIANYFLSLETNNAGDGVALFRKLFPKDYYAYNAGTLMSVQTSAHKTVGFNAYNNADGTAKLVGGMQYQITGTYTSLAYEDVSGNAETITPDASGYFTPTANGTLTVTGGNATDTCVHLVWDGEKDGQWEAYTENVYPLDDSLTLYGFPKLDADNRLYYDGDVYASDGTVTRKCGVLTDQTGAIGDTITLTGCDPNATDIVTSIGHLASVGTLSGTTLTLTKALNNATIVYPLETPTTETAAPYQNPQVVDDFGTEEYVDYAVAAGTRDVAVPVGHDTVYLPNLRAKLEMSPNSPSGDGTWVVQQENGENVYVPLIIPNELPETPGSDGTYVLKVVVADGTPTLSWVAE